MVVLQQELVLRKKNTHIWCIFRGTSTNVGKNGISRPHQLQFILQWISHIDVNPTRSWTKSWDSCRCVCVSIVVHTCGKMRLFGCVHRVQIPYFVWQSSKKTFLLTVIFMHRKIRRRLLLSVVVLCLLSGRTQKSKEEYVSCIQSLLFVVCILSVIVVVKAESSRLPDAEC